MVPCRTKSQSEGDNDRKRPSVFSVSLRTLCPSYLGFPHEPELKYVNMPATLDCLVTCVISGVVLFVWLEQVAGAH